MDKVSFRLGPLAKPLARKLERTGETLSEYLRRLIAKDLGVKPPDMREGNPVGRRL